MKNLFTLLFTISFSHTALSQSPNSLIIIDPVDQFQKAPATIISRLHLRGVKTIGGYSLEELQTAFSHVHIFIVAKNDFSPRLRNDGRSNPFFQTIHLQESLAYQFTDRPEHQAFALHEHLGAVGFDDENYQLSTLLTWMSLTEARHLSRFLQNYTLENILVTKGGGSTVFDGGGDVEEIRLQLQSLRDHLEVPFLIKTDIFQTNDPSFSRP